jgi:Na+-translocating ferredoxin:NAD+ oxidoreductase RnfD subunit
MQEEVNAPIKWFVLCCILALAAFLYFFSADTADKIVSAQDQELETEFQSQKIPTKKQNKAFPSQLESELSE